MRLTLLLFTALLFGSAGGRAAELTVVTEKGHVRFAVPDEWRVLSAQTRPPVAALGFQIANPADEGTPHSTNVAVSMMNMETAAGKAAAAKVGKQYGPEAPKVSSENGWTVYSQMASQNDVRYRIVDATRTVADVLVSIRFAWPELPGNAEGYNASMLAAMRSMQSSVSGAMGTPPPRPGEVIRRPAQ